MENIVPFVGMVMAILAQASNMEINKVAMSRGTNKYIIVVYSNALATFILLPSALFIYHRSELPPISFSILCRFFSLALLGCSVQIFEYIGIEYSSAALGTALLNLIPAFTFILAIIFRMETIQWRSTSSQAKSLGTIVSIIGAFVVTFYKGPPILMNSNLLLMPINNEFLFSSQSNWILGGLFLAAESFLSALWYIVQVSTQKKYSAVLIVVLYQCFFSTLLSAIVTSIAVKDASSRSLKLDMGLVAISYTAIVGTVVRYSLITWCVWRAGALYCSMFRPLAIIFTVIMGAIFLRETLYLGSLLGALIIVGGFYAVMWGKAKEEVEDEEDDGGNGIIASSESFGENKLPLLHNHTKNTGQTNKFALCLN